ncbi:hypothetical protein GCM10028828_17600 [Corynebacterium tapiri]
MVCEHHIGIGHRADIAQAGLIGVWIRTGRHKRGDAGAISGNVFGHIREDGGGGHDIGYPIGTLRELGVTAATGQGKGATGCY